ncbi:hypothetical protein V6N13_115628 [Hibiscus sabdariffa]|uniref:Uncharacterized protein n=1 Tax=Hibiscus sabdariffa TaxID=183260 RepID=A0ABR2CSB9_9ROSI
MITNKDDKRCRKSGKITSKAAVDVCLFVPIGHELSLKAALVSFGWAAGFHTDTGSCAALPVAVGMTH